jgi:anti-sigma factor RsiW
MKCDDLLVLLNDYVEGSIAPGLCEEFERHMAGCNPCQVVVDNIRNTITIYKAGQPYELPLAFRERLHDALRQRWRQTRTQTPAGPPPGAGG